MRFFYNLLVYLLMPAYAVYWLIRAIFNKSYRHNLGQRFGFGYPQLSDTIWVHAVSVGEVVAAAPLIRALARSHPDKPMLVTTVTPTGAQRVRAIFGDDVHHCYIPFEVPPAVRRLFTAVDPCMVLIVETEIWPNLYRACGERKIPLVLASARISPTSVANYRRLLPLFRETLSHGIVIAAQSRTDADRFLELGASPDRTRVTGNIKFDIELPHNLVQHGRALRASTFGDRPVWVAASTHDGEEQILLDVQSRLRTRNPDMLLVLVPRHPERFSTVREMLVKAEIPFVARTEDKACDPETSVFLGDTMGEVTLFFAAADIAFVGGSLVPIGGHNLLEPAALGRPVITGPHLFNAPEIAHQFVQNDACRMVSDADELEAAVARLIDDEAESRRLGGAAKSLVEDNRGALSRLMELIEPLLESR